MQYCEREITKEEYDEIMTASNGHGHVPINLETKYFNICILCGYGLYGTKVREENGKYFLDYSIGETCD